MPISSITYYLSLWITICFALLANLAQAQTDLTPPAGFGPAAGVFMKAAAGDNQATNEAVKAFESLAAVDSADAPLYLAYLGAAQSMQGRDAFMPWTKMKAAEHGLDTLDKALRRLTPAQEQLRVRGTPVALEVKFLAASTFVQVPNMFFHRADRGRALLAEVVNSPLYASSPAAFRSQVDALLAKTAGK
jgi:hypothetical protein